MIKKFFNFFTDNNVKEEIHDPVIWYVQNICKKTKNKDYLNKKIEEAKYIVIDTETTGIDPKKDAILSIAAIKIKNFRIVNIYNTFIDAEVEIPEESKKYHNIEQHHLKDKPKIYEIIPDLIKFIGPDAVIVGHHIKFDFEILNREIQKFFNSKLYNPTIDTGNIYRFLNNTDDTVSLDEIIEKYLSKVIDRHSALGDALVTAEVFIKMIQQLGKSFTTLKDLMGNGLIK